MTLRDHLDSHERDVTDLWRAESELAASEKRFRVLFDQAAVGVGVIETATGRFLRVNRKYADIIGYSEAEMASMDFMQITHEADLAGDLASMKLLVEGEVREFAMEKRLLRKDGTVIWVALTVSPMWAEGEPASEHIAVVQDVTERRAAEEKGRHARVELESMLAALPDLLFDIDDEGRIYTFHTPDPELLAAPPEVFLGQKIRDFLPPSATTVIHAAIDEALLLGRSTGRTYVLSMRGVDRSFEIRIARKSVDAGRPRLIAIARDVTERVQAEELRRSLEAQLRQSQKMEAVGTLAGGIAHDFNNLLAIVGLNVESARRDVPADHDVVEALDSIESVVWRARNLVQQILAFSRKQTVKRETVSANDAVVEATTLLRATLPAGIQVSVTLDDASSNVFADPTQLQQVLINLGTNAWQAIEGGVGNIRFAVSRAEIDSEEGSIAPGTYARLEVGDDGVGMSPAVLERIFEPFFTTKAPGKGSGLGLSVVHGIVADHGGVIRVVSEVGRGTTFIAYLPITSGGVETPAAGSKPAPIEGRGASILVVDDEPLLIRPALRLLERLGYRPTGFTRPRAALDAIRADPSAFDLVITDLSMPELSGLDLAREIVAVRKDLPIVLVSGFAPQANEELRNLGIVQRLTKPFDAAALSHAINEALGVRPQA